MFGRMPFNHPLNSCASQPISHPERNFKDDLKTALDLIIEFKEKIDKLHPNVHYVVEGWLKN